MGQAAAEAGFRWFKLIVSVVSIATVVSFMGWRPSEAGAGAATEAVKGTVNEVIRILDDESFKKPEKADERRHQLEKIIGTRFSYEEMSRRSLGVHWQSLNEQQRKEFVDAFKTFLSNSYADRIAGYSGEQVQYLSERLEQNFAEVRTKVVSKKTEIPLDYRLINKDSDWKVYDVVVDGVSLVNNYRGQFAKIIKTSSYEELLEKLKKKSEKIVSPTP